MKKAIAAVFLLLAVLLSLLPVFTGCGNGNEPGKDPIRSVDDLQGKRVGVQTGTIFGELLEKKLPGSIVDYANSNADLALMLNTGKVDAILIDEPVGRVFIRDNPFTQLALLETNDCAFIFRKGTAQSNALRAQMNEFLAMLRKDGTLGEIDGIWFGADESAQNVDYTGLTGENGTLKFAVCSDIGYPFCYVRDGKYAGYDVDLAVRFCRAYGYGIKIEDSTFGGMLSNVSGGKADFGASCITVTDARKESVDFSDPNYASGAVLLVRAEPSPLRIGVVASAMFDTIAEKSFPGCSVTYAQADSDLALMLNSGKIDAYLADEPVAKQLLREFPEQRIASRLTQEDYGFIFAKNDAAADELRAQLNAFIAEKREDGTLAAMMEEWIDHDPSQMPIPPVWELTGENGTIDFSTYAFGLPFVFIRDGRYTGFDIDFIYRFCLAHGYRLNVTDSGFDGLLASVKSGKSDIGGCCLAITEERKQTMLFSDPYYSGGVVMVVPGNAVTVATENGLVTFFRSVGESFEKTFLRENRWQLFLSGILTTLLITVFSAVIGTVIGSGLYLLDRRGIRAISRIIDAFIVVLGRTPVVVILMIVYYIIFGKTAISGFWVSVICFSLLVSFSVVGHIRLGVSAVEPGQTEASLALGYTRRQTFFRVVLPQAMKYILPPYKNSLVALIKDTAIVGYITVQDLTKISDIVRSRTFDAFFPIIVTAIFYFLIACLLIFIVRHVELGTDTRRRKPERILKGVKTK